MAKKIKLSEFLENCTEERIAIGTNHGGSFLYFGPPDIEAVKEAFEEYTDKKHDQLISNYHKLEAMMFTKPNFIRTYDDSEYEIGMKLMDRAHIMSNLYIAINSTEKWFATYVDSFNKLDRDVVDNYQKKVDDCVAVIIDGTEQGPYMLYDEFVDRNNK